ncbi:YitT family protein [Anaerocolumna chitinilytica]|uniref:Membrane protein n=1 Tax=Anaerocolumna chitinilytica TaxID=1727145 RepID=A0A7I8DFL9_9FIRM|nr:YitT family protein [Anaerocolumna chitinilytica]BCJ97180.1 membrane protein [Anaerocolumna chitinilytica]
MIQNKHNYLSTVFRILMIITGACFSSIGLEIFLIPNNIIDGGIIGLSIISSYLSGLPLGLFTFALNFPFFLIGYKQIGKTFVLSTAFAVICLSIGVSILHPIPGVTHDIFLAAIFGGIINGTGVGLIIRAGGSLDGTEIVAIILDKKVSFSIGQIVMFFNFFILSGAGFIYGWDRAMYSLVAYFIAFKMIDIVVEGLDESKAVMIVSDRNEDITSAIIDRLGRGVTLLNGQGGFSRLSTNVIYVVVSRLEIAKIKNIVHSFDNDALVTIGSIEVAGKKYKKKSIH